MDGEGYDNCQQERLSMSVEKDSRSPHGNLDNPSDELGYLMEDARKKARRGVGGMMGKRTKKGLLVVTHDADGNIQASFRED